METTMITQHMVTQVERARLPLLAERGRLVEEALVAREPRPAHWPLRGWLGRVLHLTATPSIHETQTAAVESH